MPIFVTLSTSIAYYNGKGVRRLYFKTVKLRLKWAIKNNSTISHRETSLYFTKNQKINFTP
jgi:hypothetical protein